jgi:biopolymer transport protein ExbB
MEKITLFVQFMNEGGSVNWIIGGLYCVVLGIFSERGTYFFCTRCRRERMLRTFQTGDISEGFEESLTSSEQESQLYRIAKLYIDNAGKSSSELSELLDREGGLIKREMERGIGFLSFIGTVAPLLGLLGTITGLMESFSQIEQRGAGADISFLSGGIREAMITTASGLITAICAVSAEKWFDHLAAARLQDMALGLSVLTERIGVPCSGGPEEQVKNETL